MFPLHSVQSATIEFLLMKTYQVSRFSFKLNFHFGMKLTCKQKFFHPGMRFYLGYMLTLLKRSSKCENVRYRKNQVFLKFIINSKSELKELGALFLRHLPRKTLYEI